MNKSELIAAAAAKANASKLATEIVVGAAIDSIAEALAGGESVRLIGFGTFSVVERKARTGRNPQTGKAIKIQARKVVRFKPGSGLAAAANKGKKKKL